MNRLFLMLSMLPLAGCAVGPDFSAPTPPKVDTYTTQSISETAAHQPELNRGGDIPQRWWSLYHSQKLDRMIRLGLQDSPNLAAARATLLASQEDYASQSGTILYPKADIDIKSDRRKISGVTFGQTGGFIYTLHNASVDVSYSLDPFGGGRRYLESLRAQVDYQGYQLEASHLALTANIVTSAISEASIQGQLKAMQDIVENEEHQLKIVERQWKLGVVTEADVLARRAALTRAQSQLPPLEKQLAQMKHRLAVLIGHFPGETGMPEFSLADLHLPQNLPLSLPSGLVRQRPDIRAAEAQLHQASAQVGVATANLYPSVTISASYGRQTVKFVELLTNPASSVWSIGSSLLQPLFHGGELTARRRQTLASFNAARAQYRQTVLVAFQDVADVLLALQSDARALELQEKAESLSAQTLKLVQRQFDLGAAGYLLLLNAQQQYRQSHVGVIQARAALMADTAALFQAMGGGWWHRNDAYRSVSGDSPAETNLNSAAQGEVEKES